MDLRIAAVPVLLATVGASMAAAVAVIEEHRRRNRRRREKRFRESYIYEPFVWDMNHFRDEWVEYNCR
jgi:hypothetical protein